MLCVSCGKRAGYHRAVVDLSQQVSQGSLCVRCEESAFGTTLARTERRGTECVLCRRDGTYALPPWESYTSERPDGALVSHVDWRVDETTLTLCDEHLHELCSPNADVSSPESDRD